MNNYNNTYLNQSQMTNESLENMYPEIYRHIHPMLVKAADDIRQGGYPLSDTVINTSVDNVIKMSGLWHEDDDLDPGYDAAIPVSAGFGRRRFRRGFHNRNTLRDLGRILLLRELLF